MVVGVAHTALYGDIVIGIPYKKRFMFNAQASRQIQDLSSYSNKQFGGDIFIQRINEFYNLYIAAETRESSPEVYSPAVDGI